MEACLMAALSRAACLEAAEAAELKRAASLGLLLDAQCASEREECANGSKEARTCWPQPVGCVHKRSSGRGSPTAGDVQQHDCHVASLEPAASLPVLREQSDNWSASGATLATPQLPTPSAVLQAPPDPSAATPPSCCGSACVLQQAQPCAPPQPLSCESVDPDAGSGLSRTPAPLLATSTAPLMALVLRHAPASAERRTTTEATQQQQQQPKQQQQQQQQQQTQDQQQPGSKGKRGFIIEPDALKRLVARQATPQQRYAAQPAQTNTCTCHVDGKEQKLQPAQDAASLLASSQQAQAAHAAAQRLSHVPHHRQRCLARVPQHHVRAPAECDADTPPGGAAASVAAGGAPLESPAAALPLLGSLASPADAEIVGIHCASLEQPVVLELDTARVFGSAQKRLRLSLADESAPLGVSDGPRAGAPPARDQLEAALTSPVPFPGSSTRGGSGAAGTAIAAARTNGSDVVARVLVEPAGPGGPGVPAAAAVVAAAAAAPVPQLATPSKFFAGSPATTPLRRMLPVGAGAGAVPPPAFVTPSKFLNASPGVSGDAGHAAGTPATPLFGFRASPVRWPGHGPAGDTTAGAQASEVGALRSSAVVQQRQGSGSVSLGTSDRGCGSGVGPGGACATPSAWVPVTAGCVRQGSLLSSGTPGESGGGGGSASSNGTRRRTALSTRQLSKAARGSSNGSGLPVAGAVPGGAPAAVTSAAALLTPLGGSDELPPRTTTPVTGGL